MVDIGYLDASERYLHSWHNSDDSTGDSSTTTSSSSNTSNSNGREELGNTDMIVVPSEDDCSVFDTFTAHLDTITSISSGKTTLHRLHTPMSCEHEIHMTTPIPIQPTEVSSSPSSSLTPMFYTPTPVKEKGILMMKALDSLSLFVDNSNNSNSSNSGDANANTIVIPTPNDTIAGITTGTQAGTVPTTTTTTTINKSPLLSPLPSPPLPSPPLPSTLYQYRTIESSDYEAHISATWEIYWNLLCGTSSGSGSGGAATNTSSGGIDNIHVSILAPICIDYRQRITHTPGINNTRYKKRSDMKPLKGKLPPYFHKRILPKRNTATKPGTLQLTTTNTIHNGYSTRDNVIEVASEIGRGSFGYCLLAHIRAKTSSNISSTNSIKRVLKVDPDTAYVVWEGYVHAYVSNV